MVDQATPELLRDPISYARLLKHVHDAVLSGVPAPRPPRSVISKSWDRSLAAEVNPDAKAPPLVFETDEILGLREQHPLAGVLPVFRKTLVSIADEAEHVMIVTDHRGHILWREGARGVCEQADRVLLAEGTRWSEDVIGTNAMGTTLATGEPVQIYSAEHLVRAYHEWTCAAAPVHDPDTGAVLGAIDISGPLRTVHPATLALVTAAAELAESQLRVRMDMRDERMREANMPYLRALRGQPGALLSPTGRVLTAESCGPLPQRFAVDKVGELALDDGRLGVLEPLSEGYLLRLGNRRKAPPAAPRLGLEFLGATEPLATVDNREMPLSLRHAEILFLLATNPSGMTGEQLALALYGDAGNPVTVRAEIHRLRVQLGAAVVRTRPYRLAAELRADFLDVRAAVRRGDVDAAAEVFRGALLPNSEAPAIRDEREALTGLVRRVVLDSNSTDALWQFAETACGRDDYEVQESLCRALPSADPRRAMAMANLGRIDV